MNVTSLANSQSRALVKGFAKGLEIEEYDEFKCIYNEESTCL